MSRRATLIIVSALLLVLLAAGTIGYLVRTPFRSNGSGQSRNSPDRKWTAYATTFEEWSVQGGTRRFSELRIDSATKSGQTVRKMILEDTAVPSINWSQEGDVFWAKNSSQVTFKCVTGKANLEISMVP